MYRSDTSDYTSGFGVPSCQICEAQIACLVGTCRGDRPAPVLAHPRRAARRYAPPVRTQRLVVDYTLRRRALLRDVHAGRVSTMEACDASPYLVRASRFFGEPTETRCPVCRREPVWNVHYIYGDELRTSAGQARGRAELPVLAMTYGAFDVYVVEVCRGCGWNYLVEKFTLGRDGLAPRERQRQLVD